MKPLLLVVGLFAFGLCCVFAVHESVTVTPTPGGGVAYLPTSSWGGAACGMGMLGGLSLLGAGVIHAAELIHGGLTHWSRRPADATETRIE